MGREALTNAVPIWKAVHAEIETGLKDPDQLRAELLVLSRPEEGGAAG